MFQTDDCTAAGVSVKPFENEVSFFSYFSCMSETGIFLSGLFRFSISALCLFSDSAGECVCGGERQELVNDDEG